jgi:hypothetical protein
MVAAVTVVAVSEAAATQGVIVITARVNAEGAEAAETMRDGRVERRQERAGSSGRGNIRL